MGLDYLESKNLEAFIKERDEAFLSLDKDKIVAYCEKYGVPIPESEEVVWAGVHKAICNINSVNAGQKLNSMICLVNHGFTLGY